MASSLLVTTIAYLDQNTADLASLHARGYGISAAEHARRAMAYAMSPNASHLEGRKDDPGPRNVKVRIRMPAEMKEAMQACAHARGLSSSTFLAQCLDVYATYLARQHRAAREAAQAVSA